MTAGGPTVLAPVFSGPGDRRVLRVSARGSSVKESATLMSMASSGLLLVMVSMGTPALVMVHAPSAPMSSHFFRAVVTGMAKSESGGCHVAVAPVS